MPGMLSMAELAGAVSNDISVENAKPGSPPEEWDSQRSPAIEGFTTQFSVLPGGTVGFKVKTDSTDYRIRIYRLGWYGGLGARRIADVTPSVPLPQSQPTPITDAATGLVDCGNWATSGTWTVPATAVSGVYYALFERLDGEGERNHALFVVRRSGPSDVLVQTSEATWQAYNIWGGRCLYPWVQQRAYKVSYNRPETPYYPETDFFSMEYALVRWLERNGYDVAYCANVDTHRDPAGLLNRKVFISTGHDEYWSGPMRANVEAARDAGLHLIFMTGNEVFWRTRYEPSTGGPTTSDRTIVCYKESISNAKIDPSAEWTGTWRDPRFSPPAQGGANPENSLTGQLFAAILPTGEEDFAIKVPYEYSQLRFWRNTSVAALQPGQTRTLALSTLGYEFDIDADNGHRPATSIRLSSTTVTAPRILQDWADTYAEASVTHTMTLYRAPSGALVWGTGTTQWSYGLDEAHITDPGVPESVDMQQATLNMLGDMGVQPATRQAGLVAASGSPDTVPPSTTITSPAAGATIPVATPVTISGTVTDAGGGHVAWVEVSVDDGATWQRALGTSSWSCVASLPSPLGPRVIRARAIDDSCNLEVNGPTVTVTVGPRPTPCSIWSAGATPVVAAADDTQAVEVGVKFRPLVDGFITGVRFYKGPGNGGTHSGNLWTKSGVRLAQATFTSESASGWQTVSFAPVAVSAGATYVASVHMPQGRYARDPYAFQSAGYEAWPLRALADGEDGGNGVYRYGASGFPSASSAATNYWVDVVFDVTNDIAPTVALTTPAAGLQSVSRTSPVTITFSEGMNPGSLVFELRTPQGALVGGATTYDGPTRTLSFVGTDPLPALTTLTATLVSGRDAAGAALGGPHSWSFTTIGEPGTTPTSVWDTSATPAGFVHDTPFELGVRFRVDVAGAITALRCYRAPDSTRQEVGHLWASDGTLLATAAFPTDAPSGWQQANLTTPVPIQKNTTYIASYHAPDGRFALTHPGLTASVDRAPIHAPASTAEAGNGVFRFGPPGFPTNSWEASNYWADVVFEVPPDATAPTLANVEPAPGLVSVAIGSPLRATFDGPVQPASVLFTLHRDGQPVAGATSYDPATSTATFDPSNDLAPGARYDAAVSATDVAGNAMPAPFTWAFTTSVAAGATPATLWDTAATPETAATDDNGAIELGVAFQPERAGHVAGIRFYKGPGNGGTHIGHLWTGNGQLLGSVTFSGETASGWQQAMFSTPIAVTAGATYVASYHAPQGRYSVTRNFFANPVVRPPLTAPASINGRYQYGAGGFPASLFADTNYWVDLVFVDQQGPSVVGQAPTSGATGVPEATTVAATFDEAVVESTITFQLRDAGGAVVAGTTSYDQATKQVTFTPDGLLASATSYTASITEAEDPLGNPMAAPSLWSFTTGDTSVSLLWPDEPTPAVVDAGDGGSVELGVKFQVTTPGVIERLRFYKSAANTGTHVGRIYGPDGAVLGSVTFGAETASGWQEAAFATPVPVQPGVTYVASYHAPNGRYSVNGWYFSGPRVSGALRAPATGEVGGNGVYQYGSGGSVPANTYNAGNYWVDVRFRRQP